MKIQCLLRQLSGKMKNALFKDTIREIRRTLGRFLSIFAIVAIGVSFFAGVKATKPDMKKTADKYFDDYNLMDIRILSTMGFNNDDVNAIAKSPKIEGIYPGYSIDTLVKIKDKDLIFKVISLPVEKLKGSSPSYINRVKLIKGRYPEKPNECLAEKGKIISSNITIGSKIKLSSGDNKNIRESLKNDEYTVVGIVQTPYYLSFDRGTTTIGSGKINSFLIVPEENFKMPVYTEVYVTVKGAKKLPSYGDEYKDLIKPVKAALENVGKLRTKERYNEIVEEANSKIADSKKQLQEAQEKQKSELDKAALKLQNSEKQIANVEKNLRLKEAEANKTLESGESKIAAGYKKLYAGEQEYTKQLAILNESKKQAEARFAEAENKLEDTQKQINENETQLNTLKSLLQNPNLPNEKRVQIETQVIEGEQQLNSAKLSLNASKNQLELEKARLQESETKLQKTKQILDISKNQLKAESSKLELEKTKTKAQLAEAYRKLDDSKKKLEQGKRDYEKSKKESNDKIAEGYAKLSDGEKDIKKIEEPVWYVLDRYMHADFVEYCSNADRIGAIAQVFPVFFFLVAALVCLTTMTRMVDEQRINIGTLKALGYSKLSIASKYLLYAVSASLSGSIFGVLVGFKVFPTVIFDAYGIMYTMPPIIASFNVTYAVISTAAAVLTTTLSAWAACYNELMIEPAELMRPKAPKLGKRILLERVKFIWRRLSFMQKVTARNIFRYKKRFLMTILGISGCTALLLAGFGLKDSIASIVTKQFDELYQYDMVLDLKKASIKEDAIKFTDNRIVDYMLVKQQSVDVDAKNIKKSATLYVPEDSKKLKDFIILRSRTTKEKVPFKENSVILTEKLARTLQVKTGDSIYIKNSDNRSIPVKVGGITENYVYHYVYMSPSLYEKIYGSEAAFQNIIAKTSDSSEQFENKLSSDMLKNPDISSVSFITGISKNFKDIIVSLNYVVIVLIISAGALAFVVLYNLTNINVTERLREIATIKVLGFYDDEVSAYVYRENIFLTIIGIGAGLILGIILHRFIVVTAEIDYVMFGRNINPPSYIFSALLTLVFSGFVNFVMYFKLKKVGMVESLKSVD